MALTVSQIYTLNCTDKNNRRLLLKELIKALKLNGVPTITELEGYSLKIANKFKIRVGMIKMLKDGRMQVNIEHVGPECEYTFYYSNSYYEALCKYILYVKAMVKK